MDKAKLVHILHQLTELFRAFVSPHRNVAWDGCVNLEYPPPNRESVKIETVVWFARLSTMEALLEYQDSPPTDKQIEYIRSWLLGGMMSLSDFSFCKSESGQDHAAVNEELGRLRHELFLAFGKRH
jgi:hypothetical protein